jgi:hypothetical protein
MGSESRENGQYVVHMENRMMINRFRIHKRQHRMLHQIRINTDSIYFVSYAVRNKHIPNQLLHKYQVVRPLNMSFANTRFRMNLWLYDKPDIDKRLPKVVIHSFRYVE